jgi:hypothetical protein
MFFSCETFLQIVLLIKSIPAKEFLTRTASMVARDHATAAHRAKSFSVARKILAVAILGAAAILMFARLGHYALWDDEAMTGLPAISVWRTGDTVALVDRNIVAYRSGAELRNLRLRYIPPFPFYLAAPFVGLLGAESLPARLPFALCGMATIFLLVGWLWKDNASLLTWLLLGLAILGNVSLFLYSRQSRYYSVAIAASAGLAYLYLHWDGLHRPAIIAALLSFCLFASNYFNYVALYVCMGIDYLIWRRKHAKLQGRDWLVLFLPQIVIGLPIALIWNPLRQNVTGSATANVLADKMVLFWWNLRDLNQCEFGVGLLFLLLPALYFILRDLWLLRGIVAFLVYILVVTLLSPQPVNQTVAADVRYLAPLIPLCIFLGMAVVRGISAGKWWLALPIAAVAFGTNVLQLYPFTTGEFRSTIVQYVRELLDPPNDPYREAAKWINAHVKERQSIWILPAYMTYPLMYHAPKAIYAWQLSNPPEPQFAGLDPIHFRGVVPPDYVIAFGPVVRDVKEFLHDGESAGIEYKQIETLEIYWRDLYRPELFARTFKPITQFDRNLEAIYIFRRVSPPIGIADK